MDTVSIPQQSSRRGKRSKDGSSLPQSQTDPAPAADAGTIEVTTSQQSKKPKISRSERETDAGKINTSQPPNSKRKKVDLAPKKQRTASDTAATVKDPTPSSTPAEPLLIQNAAIQTKKVVDKNSLLSANRGVSPVPVSTDAAPSLNVKKALNASDVTPSSNVKQVLNGKKTITWDL